MPGAQNRRHRDHCVPVPAVPVEMKRERACCIASNEHNEIMRKSRFCSGNTVSSFDKFVCNRRSKFDNEIIQRRRRVVPGFYFYGNYFAVLFNQELNFMFAVRLEIIQNVPALKETFDNCVFVYSASGDTFYRVVKNSSACILKKVCFTGSTAPRNTLFYYSPYWFVRTR